METQNIISFERLTREFDALFEYTFQLVPKLNLLSITFIQSEHGIRIDKADHIINNIIQ